MRLEKKYRDISVAKNIILFYITNIFFFFGNLCTYNYYIFILTCMIYLAHSYVNLPLPICIYFIMDCAKNNDNRERWVTIIICLI